VARAEAGFRSPLVHGEYGELEYILVVLVNKETVAAPLNEAVDVLAKFAVQVPDAELGAGLKRFVEVGLVAYEIVQSHVESPPFRGKTWRHGAANRLLAAGLRIALRGEQVFQVFS
jgi:hypothetical protein